MVVSDPLELEFQMGLPELHLCDFRQGLPVKKNLEPDSGQCLCAGTAYVFFECLSEFAHRHAKIVNLLAFSLIDVQAICKQ